MPDFTFTSCQSSFNVGGKLVKKTLCLTQNTLNGQIAARRIKQSTFETAQRANNPTFWPVMQAAVLGAGAIISNGPYCGQNIDECQNCGAFCCSQKSSGSNGYNSFYDGTCSCYNDKKELVAECQYMGSFK